MSWLSSSFSSYYPGFESASFLQHAGCPAWPIGKYIKKKKGHGSQWGSKLKLWIRFWYGYKSWTLVSYQVWVEIQYGLEINLTNIIPLFLGTHPNAYEIACMLNKWKLKKVERWCMSHYAIYPISQPHM